MRDYGTGTWVGGDPNCPHKRMNKFSEKTNTGHAQAELAGNVGDAIYKTVCPLCGAVRVDKQIGLEETPEEYIQKLTDVFHEVKRVMKDDGTLWVNIGDTYNGNKKGNTEVVKHSAIAGKQDFHKKMWDGAKPKDLIGIPWMLAFALRADGWYLRQDIIYHKLNPMPEPVKDRCVKSHERWKYKNLAEKGQTPNTMHVRRANGEKDIVYPVRNKRDVWTVATQPIKEAHFATFPEELIKPCILAGSQKNGIVLDPFFGSGTTGRVAVALNRRYLGIELNPEYIQIEKKRTDGVQMSIEGFM